MKKLLATAMLAVSFLVSPLIFANAAFVPPGAACQTMEQDKTNIKNASPDVVFATMEGEEKTIFISKIRELGFPKSIEVSSILVAKIPTQVGFSLYDAKGCLVYFEVNPPHVWEKFLDIVFGSGA